MIVEIFSIVFFNVLLVILFSIGLLQSDNEFRSALDNLDSSSRLFWIQCVAMKSLEQQLQNKHDNNQYRQRDILESPQSVRIQLNGKQYLSFSSNDYLGLANDSRIIEASIDALRHYGLGSGAAHLITGHSCLHHQLEEMLAQHTGRSRALLYSTGYMANVGAISALCGKGDLVIEDKLNHASLIDGGLISDAKFKRYKHSDMENLESILSKSDESNKLIVTDGVFSMDGDIAAMPSIMKLAKKYQADVYVDDAHGFGVLGNHGGGVCEQFTLVKDDEPIIMGTLGKAFGVFGAFIAGSENLIEWLIQQSRMYIFTTAMPPSLAAASIKSLEIIQKEGYRREHLTELIAFFRNEVQKIGLALLPSITPIQPIIVGEEKKAIEWSEYLRGHGVLVKAIRPPTVPVGTSRLRITLSAAHNKEDVSTLVKLLARLI